MQQDLSKIRTRVAESTYFENKDGGARGVMVIVEENGHGDTSSNHGWSWVHFPKD